MLRDDPLSRQVDIEERAGAYQGTKKYGAKANLPPTRARKPGLDEMGPGSGTERPKVQGASWRPKGKKH